MHFVYYEEMKKDPVLEIGKLCRFFGKDCSLAEEIATKTNFEQMKHGVQNKRTHEEKVGRNKLEISRNMKI